ncbi:MAG TPA: C40 family peptidase [Steroidobacteraceae bacterium]
MIRAALAAVLSIALAACASTAPNAKSTPPAATSPAALPRASPSPRTLMVDTAISMRGQPYRFGGAAPGGFDCSGLVQYAASGAGLHVPRTAHEQLRIGEPIARGELQPGDLVFMHLAHKQLHVGIAIDADRFVHAPSKGGVIRVDSLDAPPYARGFLGARRIIATP